MAGEAAGETNKYGSTFRCPTEGRPEGATARGETKRLDIRGDVYTCRREILRTPVPTIRAGIQTETWEGGKEESGGRPETEGGRSGGRGGGADGGGYTPRPGGVAPHTRLVC